jgi:LysW-gamma-L-lysine carboxypeptidase
MVTSMASELEIQLIRDLVAIPSRSRQEGAATAWLAQQMVARGFDRAVVDAAGHAVGELGASGAAQTIVLLGHIDTVPGDIPVRIVDEGAGSVLYGRGSVDAKGPLATLVAAAARRGSDWARAHDVRLVVVGAVEEEAATSKGARFIRDRFDGTHEPVPDACIIGEPSNWRRVTLGYKGRILIDLRARQPMAHTAGPDAGVATTAVALWNWLEQLTSSFNQDRDKAFDQLLPSLRSLETGTDAAMQDWVEASAGIRLPVGFDPDEFVRALRRWGEGLLGTDATSSMEALSESTDASHNARLTVASPTNPLSLSLTVRGYEPAWRSGRNNGLVRAFLAAIRSVDPTVRPGFVVKTGTSDMNVVAPAWQCPILAYGPGDSALDHTPHEHLSIDEYGCAIDVLEEALGRMVA